MMKNFAIILLALLVCVPAAAKKDKKKGREQSAKTFVLVDRSDSLSYCLGYANGGISLKPRLLEDFGIDSCCYEAFTKAFRRGVACYDMADVAEAVGFYHGLLVRLERVEKMIKPMLDADTTMHVNYPLFVDVMTQTFFADSMQMDGNQVNEYMKALQEDLDAKLLQAYKIENEQFLIENAKNDSVVQTESGLQYKVLVEGTGRVPKVDSRVKVEYRCMTIDGREIDSSYRRGEPSEFVANKLIKGWTEALTMMPVGSKWMLYVPQELAYGDRVSGPIRPYSTIIFEVELLDIVE